MKAYSRDPINETAELLGILEPAELYDHALIKQQEPVLHNIPEYGAQSSFNFEEWQRRCKLALSSEIPKDHLPSN
jgi:hypothetical protein